VDPELAMEYAARKLGVDLRSSWWARTLALLRSDFAQHLAGAQSAVAAQSTQQEAAAGGGAGEGGTLGRGGCIVA
jgi:uncharacterized membrane protein